MVFTDNVFNKNISKKLDMLDAIPIPQIKYSLLMPILGKTIKQSNSEKIVLELNRINEILTTSFCEQLA